MVGLRLIFICQRLAVLLDHLVDVRAQGLGRRTVLLMNMSAELPSGGVQLIFQSRGVGALGVGDRT